MDKFYKLLIMFHEDEYITQKRLLRIFGINEKLIDEAEKLGFIEKTIPSDIDEIRYKITKKGMAKW